MSTLVLYLLAVCLVAFVMPPATAKLVVDYEVPISWKLQQQQRLNQEQQQQLSTFNETVGQQQKQIQEQHEQLVKLENTLAEHEEGMYCFPTPTCNFVELFLPSRVVGWFNTYWLR